MKRIATIFEGDKIVGLVHGPDAINQKIVVNGRTWMFDFDDMFGPLWLKKNGSERKCQNPSKKVWNAFDKWFKEYSEK